MAAAAALLPLAETVFSRPSAEFGAIFDQVKAILQAVMGTAEEEAGPLTSAQLEVQAEMLAERIECSGSNWPTGSRRSKSRARRSARRRKRMPKRIRKDHRGDAGRRARAGRS